MEQAEHRAPSARGLAQRVLGNRLTQFAFLGGLIFALAPRPPSPRNIDVTSARLDELRRAEATRIGLSGLPPDRTKAVDQRALEDELLFREGLRLGLDKNDGIVRERVIQKVLFLAEESAGASRAPTDAELESFFEKNRARWNVPERLHLKHVFRHDRAALDAWMAGPKNGAPPTSEPSPVPPDLESDGEAIAEVLGPKFRKELADAPLGRWFGPIASPYGYHLVLVSDRTPARPATLAEVHPQVLEACVEERRADATAAFLQSTFARYHVTVDGVPLRTFVPTRRTAFRSVSSGED